jgi:hypothetical protein
LNIIYKKAFLDNKKLEKIIDFNYNSLSSCKINELRILIKKLFLLKNEMMHFIKNLQNFINLEVIESAWKTFMDDF